MKSNLKITAILAAFLLALGLGGCEREETVPMEDAAENIGDSMEDAAENAGDKIEDTAERAEDKLD